MVGQAKATRAVVTALVGGALLVGGCRTNREVARPDPVPVTEELLTESLLTQDDVPSPYTLVEDADVDVVEMIPEADCDDRLTEIEPQETATAVFTGEGLGTALSNTISYYPGNGDAIGSAYSNLIEDCSQVVVEDAGLSFTAESLDFGVLSDDTLPIVFVLEYDDGTIERTEPHRHPRRRPGEHHPPRRTPTSDLVLLDSVTRIALGNLGLLEQAT